MAFMTFEEWLKQKSGQAGSAINPLGSLPVSPYSSQSGLSNDLVSRMAALQADEDKRKRELALLTEAADTYSTPHPYANNMSQWNAIKADAFDQGMTDLYGMPTDQYYEYTKGKPDWMIQADQTDMQRTVTQNPVKKPEDQYTVKMPTAAAQTPEQLAANLFTASTPKLLQEAAAAYGNGAGDALKKWNSMMDSPVRDQFDVSDEEQGAYRQNKTNAPYKTPTAEDVFKKTPKDVYDYYSGKLQSVTTPEEWQTLKDEFTKYTGGPLARGSANYTDTSMMFQNKYDAIQKQAKENANKVADFSAYQDSQDKDYQKYLITGKISPEDSAALHDKSLKTVYDGGVDSVLSYFTEKVNSANDYATWRNLYSDYDKIVKMQKNWNTGTYSGVNDLLMSRLDYIRGQKYKPRFDQYTQKEDAEFNKYTLDYNQQYAALSTEEDAKWKEYNSLIGRDGKSTDPDKSSQIADRLINIQNQKAVLDTWYQGKVQNAHITSLAGQQQQTKQEEYNRLGISLQGVDVSKVNMDDRASVRALAQSAIDEWQKKYDDLNADRGLMTFGTGPELLSGDIIHSYPNTPYGTWANAFETAKYNLQDAKNLMALLSDDADTYIKKGDADPGNRLSNASDISKWRLQGPGSPSQFYEYTQYLYPEEKSMYLYYLGKDGADSANTYLDSIKQSVYMRAQSGQLKDYSTSIPTWLRGVLSIASLPISGAVSAVTSIKNVLTNEDTTSANPGYTLTAMNSQARDEIIGSIPSKIGQAAMSGLFSLLDMGAVAPFGPAALVQMLSIEQAGQAAYDAEQWGADSGTVFQNMMNNYLVSVMIEKFGTGERFSKLLTGAEGYKGIVEAFIKSGIGEGFEEAVQQAIMDQMDQATNGANTAYYQSLVKYNREGGFSASNAVQLASIDAMWNLISSAVGGFVAGSFGGGATAFYETKMRTSFYKTAYKEAYPNMPEDLRNRLASAAASGKELSAQDKLNMQPYMEEAAKKDAAQYAFNPQNQAPGASGEDAAYNPPTDQQTPLEQPDSSVISGKSDSEIAAEEYFARNNAAPANPDVGYTAGADNAYAEAAAMYGQNPMTSIEPQNVTTQPDQVMNPGKPTAEQYAAYSKTPNESTPFVEQDEGYLGTRQFTPTQEAPFVEQDEGYNGKRTFDNTTDQPAPENPFSAKAQTKTGSGVVLEGFDSVGGKPTYRTSGGTTVSASDVDIADDDTRMLYSVAQNLDTPEAANTFIGMRNSNNVPAATYAKGFLAYYEAGASGRPIGSMASSVYNTALNETTREAAYEYGRQNRIEASKKAWGNYPTVVKEGQSGVVKAYTTQKMDVETQSKVAMADTFGKRMNLQIVISDSLGKANAMYYGGRTLYVGLDAIDGGITKAISHEALHYLRTQSNPDYKALMDFMTSKVGDISQSVRDKLAQYAKAGIAIDQDTAEEEVLADALPDVVMTEKNAEQLAKENPGMVQKVVAWLREVIRKLRDAFKGSKEYEAIKADIDAYENMADMFDAALERVSGKQAPVEEKSAASLSLKSTDSEGNPLTDDQREFFKDSKVVDENGALMVVYHGTPNQFTVFDKDTIENGSGQGSFRGFKIGKLGFYFTNDIEYAREIIHEKKGSYDGNVIGAYVNLKNPLIVSDSGWGSAVRQIDLRESDLMRWAKSGNHDGIIVESSDEIIYISNNKETTDKVVVAFEPNQIKSTTNEHPTASPDIRYSLKSTSDSDYDALLAENTELREAVDDLRKEFTLTEGHVPDPKKVAGLASSILKETSSGYDSATLTDNLNKLFTFISNTDGLNWNEVMGATTDLSKAVLEQSKKMNKDAYTETADMRRQLRDMTIRLTSTQMEEVKSQFGSYNNFRKRLFGNVHLSTTDGVYLDSAWQELSDGWKQYFPEDTGEGEMPIALLDAVNAMRPYYENPYGMDIDAAAADLALEIYNKYFDIPEVKTFADKAKDKLEATKAHYRNKIAEMRQNYKERLAAQKAGMKAHYAEMEAKKQREATNRANVNSIRDGVKKLAKKLSDNTAKNHVPEGLKSAIYDLLQTIDTTTGKTTETGRLALKNAKEEYKKMAETGAYEELSSFYSQDVYDALDKLEELFKDKNLSTLEPDELQLVKDIVNHFNHIVNVENKFFGKQRKEGLREAGDATSSELYSRKKRKEWSNSKFVQGIQTMLQEGIMNPTTFFDQFKGTAIWDAYVALRDGLDKHVRNNARTEDFLKSKMAQHGYSKWDLKSKTKITTDSGATIEMTLDELMTLWATWKRERLVNSHHIDAGGVMIAGEERGDPIRFNAKDIAAVEKALTPAQRSYVDDLVGYLSSVGSDWGNEVSMELYGIKLYTEKYYIPFGVSGDYVSKSPGQMMDARRKNAGFTKKLAPGAVVPVVIQPFTKLFAKHAEEMSMYNAFTTGIEDMTRLWNYKSEGTSVKGAISNTYTQRANKYIENFLRDLNGSAISPIGEGMMNHLLTYAKRASVSANLSVMLQQASAGVRAMSMIDAKYFLPGSVKGLAFKKSYAELLKWSPTAQLKQWGYFDTNMTTTIYERAKGGVMQKIQDVAAAGAQAMDELNWAQIWEAVKLETADTQPGLDRGSDAFMEAAALRFRDVIDATQVVDSVFHRTELGRSKGVGAKLLTAFKSEPLMMYNMLFRAATSGNAKQAGRTVGSVMTSIVLNAALAGIAGALRDRSNEKKDKDGKIIGVRTFGDKYIDAVAGKLMDAPFGILPYISEAYDLWQGYSIDRLDMAPLESLVNAGKTLVDGNKGWDQKLKKLGVALSMVTGVPVSNVERDIDATVSTLMETINAKTLKGVAYDTTQPIEVRLEAAKANVSAEKNPGLYYDMLTQATMAGNTKDAAAVRAELIKQGKKGTDIDSALKSRIRAAEPLVKTAAKAYLTGDTTAISNGVNKLVAAGYDQDMSVSMVKSEAKWIEDRTAELYTLNQTEDSKGLEEFKKKIEERGYTMDYFTGLAASYTAPETSDDGSASTPSMYTYKQLNEALEAGRGTDVENIVSQFMREGKTGSVIKGQVTSYFKPLYYEAYLNGNSAIMNKIETTLTQYFDYKTTYKDNDFKEWIVDGYYKDLYTAIDGGDASLAAQIKAAMSMRVGGFAAIKKKLSSKYAPLYYSLVASGSTEAAKNLKDTLTQLGISSFMIDQWGRAGK